MVRELKRCAVVIIRADSYWYFSHRLRECLGFGWRIGGAKLRATRPCVSAEAFLSLSRSNVAKNSDQIIEAPQQNA